MATFTGQGTGTTGATSYTLRLDVWEDSYDINSNSSLIKANLYLDSGNYNFHQVGIPRNIYIDGEQVYYDDSQIGIDTNSSILITSVEKRVYHNSDGRKTINCSASMTNASAYYLPGNISCSGELKLTDIPRHTNVTISQKSKDINSITISWTSDDSRDHTKYRIKEGSSNYSNWIDAGDIVASNNKSGHFKISNLKPNTSYKIQVQVKRTDSQLWSSSNEVTIITYDYAKFISVSNADFGENIIISKSNESGIADRLEMYANGSLITTRNNIDKQYYLFLTQSELDNLYKKYSVNSNNINLEYRLITTCNSKTYTDTIARIIQLTGNAKTAKIKQNGVVKRAKVFIKQNGIIKRGVLFIMQDGIIKRCI